MIKVSWKMWTFRSSCCFLAAFPIIVRLAVPLPCFNSLLRAPRNSERSAQTVDCASAPRVFVFSPLLTGFLDRRISKTEEYTRLGVFRRSSLHVPANSNRMDMVRGSAETGGRRLLGSQCPNRDTQKDARFHHWNS